MPRIRRPKPSQATPKTPPAPKSNAPGDGELHEPPRPVGARGCALGRSGARARLSNAANLAPFDRSPRAAAQVGHPVWISDEAEGYVDGEIVAVAGNLVTVQTRSGNKRLQVDVQAPLQPPRRGAPARRGEEIRRLLPRTTAGPETVNGVENMDGLLNLNEAEVLANVQRRCASTPRSLGPLAPPLPALTPSSRRASQSEWTTFTRARGRS
jgi:hypothetical protein